MAQAGASNIDVILKAAEEQLYPDSADFVGRGFVRDEVTRFLAVQNRMLVLVGPPGVGKTALALELVRASRAGDNPYLAYFCGVSGQDNPYTFCAALAEQLVDRLGANYTLPETARRQTVNLDIDVRVEQAGEHVVIKGLDLNIGGMHPREAFRQAVREPLRAYNDRASAQQGHTSLVIIVDGLDRAWEWDDGQGGNIVSVLSDAQELPVWVTLICTARPGPAVQALRARGGVQVFEIDPDGADNLADIATFFREKFIDRMSPTQREQFSGLLALRGAHDGTGGTTDEDFVKRAVAASEGNFLYVRRYVDAWWNVLKPDPSQRALDPATLLRFDGPHDSLDQVLDISYAGIYQDLRPHVDGDVMVALATAFAPLNLALLERFSGKPATIVLQSLAALLPMLEQQGASESDRTYLFYYRGFSEHVRAQNPTLAREIDRRAAQALETIDRGNALARDYSQKYRWSHLLRGLDLATRATGVAPATGAVTPIEHASVDQVLEQISDPVMQARVLRELAARALQPSRSGRPPNWATALLALTTAERRLQRSRALLQLRRYGRRGRQTAEPGALIEYEHTLIALGDAYASIVQRMDAGTPRLKRARTLVGGVQLLWDYIVQAPVTLYLLLVLLRQGVREYHVPGALQNLGRGQDWTVTRLCVLSVSAYRRAGQLAAERGADDVANDINERLARLYALMGAFRAAALVYESLLSSPAAMMSQWRQSVWRLALGEVLLAQHATDRAVEVLISALPSFEQQEAPVLRARALSALAIAYGQQAAETDARDDPRAIDLHDKMIATSDEALKAWGNVTQLTDDAGANVDPALQVSRLGHSLTLLADDPRIGIEQQRDARTLLDSIPERHYPQRFEHPVLRLFRIGAAAVLPLVVLAGLLLAVQTPSRVQIRQHADLPLRLPVLDLERFPNLIIDSNATSGLRGDDDLARTLADGSQWIELSAQLQLRTEAPALDQVKITVRVLQYVGLYLLAYIFCGMLIISRSQPARLQSRLPGRLILSHDSLLWQGALTQSSWKQTWTWLTHTPRVWAIGLGRRVPPSMRARIQQRWPRAGKLPLLAPDIPPAPPGASLRFVEIGSIIAVERRIFGYMLHDLSLRVVQPSDAKLTPIAIYGTVAYYEELCQELDRRTRVPVYHFGLELIRSAWGLCFSATLLFALLLLLLLPVLPRLLLTPLPGSALSLSHLYVLVTPGLLLPLVWWFVARPLGASGFRSPAANRLVILTLFALFLTITVGRSRGPLVPFGLNPDLATPVLTLGCLMALVVYAPRRSGIWAGLPRRSRWLRGGIAAVAALGLAFVVMQIGVTVLWYGALVKGNLLVEQALVRSNCATSLDACEDSRATAAQSLKQATAVYTEVICLRPGDSDGYALRGFAYLAQGMFPQAQTDFSAALAQPDAVTTFHTSTPCSREWLRIAPVSRAGPKQVTREYPRLYANLGSAYALQAQQETVDGQQDKANVQMQHALKAFAQAFDLRVRDIPTGNRQTWIERLLDRLGLLSPVAAPPPKALDGVNASSCALVVQELLTPQNLAGRSTVLDLLGPPAKLAPAMTGPALQLADACYSWSVAAARALSPAQDGGPGAIPLQVWQDLAATVHLYKAIAEHTPSASQERDLAERGLAAGWLTLTQINPPPAGEPDRRSRALQTLAVYDRLAAGRRQPAVGPGRPAPVRWLTGARGWLRLEPPEIPDEQVYAGQAWSAIQLGAWDLALEPIAKARRMSPRDPVYPALEGLVGWFDSTQYRTATKERPSAEWTSAIRRAVAGFDQVITLGGSDLSRVYATRSFLHVGLRNSPRGDVYQNADFAFAMRQAIADMDRALIEAERSDASEAEQAAYRFWRGRICVSLALTLQEKWRGDYRWAELVPLYSQAVNDFEIALRQERNVERAKRYRTHWQPWTRTMLHNAVQIQQAELAMNNHNFEVALRSLEQVERQPTSVKPWPDPLAIPHIDYAFMRATILLGSAGQAASVASTEGSPLAEDGIAEQLKLATDSFDEAIELSENYLKGGSTQTRNDARRTIYTAALRALRQLNGDPPNGWSEARDTAGAIEGRIQSLLEGIQ